jgi:RNA 3'-terminal phosphate cyclase (ATP)
MKEIDGSIGEGGGQVLRSCLSLSLITGQPFQLINIRKNRPRPGLSAQHLSAIDLAAQIGSAYISGAQLHSDQITFKPKSILSGKFKSEIGTAGSISLVLQTVYLPLSFATEGSTVTISGGTHVRWSPTFDYLNQNWKHYTGRLGIQVSMNLEQAGFYPQGGGKIVTRFEPQSSHR